MDEFSEDSKSSREDLETNKKKNNMLSIELDKIIKKNPVDVQSEKLLKVRQLLTLSDEKNYELENPREKKNFSYFGEVKPIMIEKNLTPLKIYIYGNYSHFQKSTMYFMLRKVGVEISNKLIGTYDMGIYWDPQMDLNKQTPKLRQNGKKIRLINLFLVDTAKDFIAKAFEKHFGYGYHIDPTKYNGYCLSKHNGNGTKSCFFLKCPINATDIFKDHSYQKIIDYTDKQDPDILYELRVPIVGGIIPFVLFKTRNRGLRFTSKNRSIQIVNPLKYLTEQECHKITTYCRYIGLELGEIDILRSHEDGKIYIIDVNNTSWWPPNKLGDVDRNIVLNLLWNSFLESFLPSYYNKYSIPDNMIDDFVYVKTPEKNDRRNIIYKYKENRFIGNQYKIDYKVMWRQLYNTGENIRFNFEEENERNKKNERNNDMGFENIVNSKINREHEDKMNKMLNNQPHLSKMFGNYKEEYEHVHEQFPSNIMNPQLMEQFQQFLRFQNIQSNMNQPSISNTNVHMNEIKSFKELSNKQEKQTERINIKQNYPSNLEKQKESLMNILNRR